MLADDLKLGFTVDDYNQDVYVSIKEFGTRVYRKCAFHETETHIFIWTSKIDYIVSKSDVGDFVIVPYDHDFHITLKKK